MASRKKNETLSIKFSKKEKDLMYYYPLGSQTVCDGHFLYTFLNHVPSNNGKTFMEELADRGYDTKTLLLSIKKNPNHGRWEKK